MPKKKIKEVPKKETTPLKRFRKRNKRRLNEVRQQLEFYFSDANLTKDRYLKQLIAEDPNVPLKVFMTFNKMKLLVNSEDDIVKALSKSELLKLSEDKTTVHRVTQVGEIKNLDERTIYVESLPLSATHDWLRACFETFGPVAYVSLPKYRNSQRIKEFAFVEFENMSGVIKAITAFHKFDGILNWDSDPENLISVISFLREQEALANQAVVTNLIETNTTESNENIGEKRLAGEANKESEASEASPESDINNFDGPLAKRVKLEESEVNDKDENDSDVKEQDGHDSDVKERDGHDSDVKEQDGHDSDVKEQDEHDADVKEPDTQANPTQKSKTRHRKVSVKNYRAAQSLQMPFKFLRTLRICTKIEWKKLRNKYLNDQHKQRKRFKQKLKLNKPTAPAQPMKKIVQNPRKINFYNANKEDIKNVDTTKIESIKTPLFTYKPGVIVKVLFDEPCPNIMEFKRKLRTQPFVKYVDVEESREAAFVRVDEPRSAPTLIKHCAPNRVQILTGDNESDYWSKIEIDWKNKINKNVKIARKKGRDKLDKRIATHLRFKE